MSTDRVTRYEAGLVWSRKSLFWLKPALGLGVVPLVLLPVQFAVEDPLWSWVISGTAAICQLSALARQIYCHHKAKKIWGV